MNCTQCNFETFEFQPENKRKVEARFDGGPLTSDGGAILVREVSKRTGILKSFSKCFTDYRDPRFCRYEVGHLVAQRVFGLVCGYEDLNDHDVLREDPLFGLLVGREEGLAGKSTLNRLELSSEEITKYKKIVCDTDKVAQIFVETFLQSQSRKTRRRQKELIIDVDATDILLHGQQEGRFFHGYYGNYCYLPLYMFCGDHLLVAKLRPSNIDASLGTEEELERIIPLIRKTYPRAKIVLRGDSGFAREAIMSWCETNGVEYLFGLARNERLTRRIQAKLNRAEKEFETHGRAIRYFKELRYRTLKSWSKARRVVAKAEYLEKGSNPRFVVTSLSRSVVCALELYEQWYCKRGDMENRIKEQFSLFADRMSTATMRANQIRLYFSSVAYMLLTELRRTALRGTELATAQIQTLREKLVKIGARVTVSVRRVSISFASGYPHQDIFRRAYLNLMTC
jgi:hypothetical protein